MSVPEVVASTTVTVAATLTISAVSSQSGKILAGTALFGTNVVAGTYILLYDGMSTTGVGDTGTYIVSTVGAAFF